MLKFYFTTSPETIELKFKKLLLFMVIAVLARFTNESGTFGGICFTTLLNKSMYSVMTTYTLGQRCDLLHLLFDEHVEYTLGLLVSL